MTDTTDLVPSPARRSLLVSMASKYGMEADTFKNVIKATVMPANASNEQVAAYLMVASTYDLNPVTREIYAFPAQGGGVTHVVGVDGWITLANRHPQFDGFEFEYGEDDRGALVSCTCTVYRKDRGRPTKITEYMSECARKTAPWGSHPRRMLRNKALIQGLRYAMGFAGLHDEDDADVISKAPINGEYTVTSSAALREIKASVAPQEPAQDLDANGVAWDPAVHSVGRSRNSNGSWRRRKGAEKPAPVTVAHEPIELTPDDGIPRYADVLRWIETAQTRAELDDAMDAGKDVDMTEEQRASISMEADAMAAIIERMQQP